jgi:DNA-directed RNA polymerase subunit beta'
MRTFHIGGAAQVNEQSNLEALCDGHVEYRDIPTIVDKRGRLLSLARNGEIALIDTDGRERAMHRVPYGTHLLHKSGATVKQGERLAEWDPFTTPIITEKSGIVKYQDLIDGRTLTEQVDEATGMTQRIITENRSTSRGKKEDLRPRLTLLDEGSVKRRAICWRRARRCRSKTVRWWNRATLSPVQAAKPPRPATSPVVCRALPNCSKRAFPRTMR